MSSQTQSLGGLVTLSGRNPLRGFRRKDRLMTIPNDTDPNTYRGCDYGPAEGC